MTIRLIASLILLDYDHTFIICVLGSQDLMMRQDLRRVGGGGILIYNTLSGICKTNVQCPLSNDITAVTGRQTDPVQSVIQGPYISFMRLCTVRFQSNANRVMKPLIQYLPGIFQRLCNSLNICATVQMILQRKDLNVKCLSVINYICYKEQRKCMFVEANIMLKKSFSKCD